MFECKCLGALSCIRVVQSTDSGTDRPTTHQSDQYIDQWTHLWNLIMQGRGRRLCTPKRCSTSSRCTGTCGTGRCRTTCWRGCGSLWRPSRTATTCAHTTSTCDSLSVRSHLPYLIFAPFAVRQVLCCKPQLCSFCRGLKLNWLGGWHRHHSDSVLCSVGGANGVVLRRFVLLKLEQFDCLSAYDCHPATRRSLLGSSEMTSRVFLSTSLTGSQLSSPYRHGKIARTSHESLLLCHRS